MPNTAPPRHQPLAPAVWIMLWTLAVIWGGSFLSNRVALEEAGVLTTVAFRVAGGALFLWAYVLWRRLPVPHAPRDLAGYAVLGILNNVVPFSLIVWGQQHIPSGLASIFNATTAVFTVCLAAVFLPDERLTLRKAAGVLLGLAGVATAIGAGALRQLDLTSLGQLAVLGAAASYAVSGIIARYITRGLRPEVAAAGMLGVSSLVMVPAAIWTEGAPRLSYAWPTWAALMWLAFVSSAIAYILFYKVLARAGAGNLSLVTLMIVPVAIALGAIVYGEALAPRAWAGFGLLALGLLVLDGRLPPKSLKIPRESSPPSR